MKATNLTAWALRLLAMGFMLLDHLWATIIPGQIWMTCVGRLAFPIFAFLLAEGYRHTSDFKKYLKRMALFALISEIPFNLMAYGMVIFPFHQNVLWTFCLALIAMRDIDRLKPKVRPWLAYLMGAAVAYVYHMVGQLAMVDYGGWGILMVLVFYLFPGVNWQQKLAQLACIYLINWEWMGSMHLPIGTFALPIQGLAIFALPLIWCYRGQQGPRTRLTKWLGYWFYPVHCLILGLLYL